MLIFHRHTAHDELKRDLLPFAEEASRAEIIQSHVKGAGFESKHAAIICTGLLVFHHELSHGIASLLRRRILHRVLGINGFLILGNWLLDNS